MTLYDAKTGQTLIIEKIAGQGIGRRRLIDMGFTPNAHITVQNIAPFKGTILVSVRGYMIAIRKSASKNIFVREAE